MKAFHKLVLLESADGWVWAYLDGKLFHNHHSLDRDGGFENLLTMLGCAVKTQYIDDGDYIKKLADLGFPLEPNEIQYPDEIPDEKLLGIAKAITERMDTELPPLPVWLQEELRG